eukprot:scaffold101228_cov20-Tisochrysis_lutea.AAC.2
MLFSSLRLYSFLFWAGTELLDMLPQVHCSLWEGMPEIVSNLCHHLGKNWREMSLSYPSGSGKWLANAAFKQLALACKYKRTRT